MGSFTKGGFQRKYDIRKADGSAVDPEAEYFVLRYDEDPCAVIALLMYCEVVEPVNPQLARELGKQVHSHLVKMINSGQIEEAPWGCKYWEKLGPFYRQAIEAVKGEHHD